MVFAMYREVCNWEMNEEECHLAPILPPEPLAQQGHEGHDVGREAEDEHEAVREDGHDLGLAEHHVLSQGEVILHHSYSY